MLEASGVVNRILAAFVAGLPVPADDRTGRREGIDGAGDIAPAGDFMDPR